MSNAGANEGAGKRKCNSCFLSSEKNKYPAYGTFTKKAHEYLGQKASI